MGRKGAACPAGERPKIAILPRRFGRRDVTTLTLLCAAGYAGNLLSIPLFSGVDLLLGGVAVMFAALRRSLAETLLVALVASLHTLLLWGHPYALVILVAEAAFVHLAVRRWQREITLCDAGFWLVAGVPLILLFYAAIMDMDAVAVGTIALKQPVNAILYTAVASLIHHALLLRAHAASRGGCRRARFADLLAPALVLFALVPTLLMLGVESHLQRQQNLDRAAAALSDARHRLSHMMAGTPPLAALESFHARGAPIGPRRPAVALVDHTGSPVAQIPDDWLTNRDGIRAVTPDVTQRFPADAAAVMKRARDSYYTRGITPPAGIGDGVHGAVVGVKAAPYVDQLRTTQIAGLGLACAIGVFSVGGASIAARRAGRLLYPLVAQLEGVPRIVRAGERVEWRDSAVAEVAQLTDSARRMETDLAEQLDALAASEERFRAIADNLPGGVYERIMDPDGVLRYTYLSPYYEHGLGLDPAQAQGDADVLIDRMPPEDRSSYRAALAHSARLLSPFDTEFRIRRPSGEARWLRSLGQPRQCPDGSVIWRGIAIDETARKRAERELEYLARHDTLTGLLNRRAILQQLGELLDQVPQLAVLCIDLDFIKAINDTLGHAVGDQVVREAASRIQSAAREADRVGRYGGDEFAVVAVGIRDEAGAAVAAERILAGLRGPMSIQGHQLEIAATIGILLHPQRDNGAEESLRKADVALDRAKKEARGEWRFHTVAMDEHLRRRAAFAEDLRAALRRDELFVEYQPKVDLGSGRVSGVEALVRWQHPVEGIVAPECFIPLAEESGLIEDLGGWVLRRACADLAEWRHQSPDEAPGHVSVNVSGRQLASNTLLDAVRAELDRNDLAPEDLELEVTESVLYDAGAEMLKRLSATGVGLAIDDYGKGYSSLLVMRDSPASVVKIDRAFIGSALTNDDDRSIVASTIALAHALRRTVVAEGVETAAHLEMLQQMGCDTAQGFYFARPAGASDIPALSRMVREHMGADW